ncbi:hypothetical protein J6590_063970 [Homalodisca vitripennis]|nr:hypothetical protein J6590_063970 [Homalodisca vitripennis]
MLSRWYYGPITGSVLPLTAPPPGLLYRKVIAAKNVVDVATSLPRKTRQPSWLSRSVSRVCRVVFVSFRVSYRTSFRVFGSFTFTAADGPNHWFGRVLSGVSD